MLAARDPQSALERITIPEGAMARITALMTPGASLIISDLGMRHETGKGTDFIVLTRYGRNALTRSPTSS